MKTKGKIFADIYIFIVLLFVTVLPLISMIVFI